MNIKFGSLFGNGQAAKSSEDQERMQQEINNLGGMLHFTITKDEDGWSAQCDEAEGIIAGGSNPNPQDYEIQSEIRAAIHSAFNVTVTEQSPRFKSEVTQVALSVM